MVLHFSFVFNMCAHARLQKGSLISTDLKIYRVGKIDTTYTLLEMQSVAATAKNKLGRGEWE